MKYAPASVNTLEALVQGLKRLPGVGVKSASRMAYHLLQHDRAGALLLAGALHEAVERVVHCSQCHTLSETPVCPICTHPQRDRAKLCVVETPADQASIERTAAYNGLYYVLMGKINPIDGVGAEQIGLPKLAERLQNEPVQELIIATNFTPEGELTAHMLSQLLEQLAAQPSSAHLAQLKTTRLARGVPIGSELEYVDLGTIAHALVDRR